ncbi:uncharacterized protein [Nothobranchius furzeri]|uniref:uncharacterized protein n=1 Tax=Nothobranchius furzeri TaxID=105023 RepID=UPI003904B698
MCVLTSDLITHSAAGETGLFQLNEHPDLTFDLTEEQGWSEGRVTRDAGVLRAEGEGILLGKAVLDLVGSAGRRPAGTGFMLHGERFRMFDKRKKIHHFAMKNNNFQRKKKKLLESSLLQPGAQTGPHQHEFWIHTSCEEPVYLSSVMSWVQEVERSPESAGLTAGPPPRNRRTLGLVWVLSSSVLEGRRRFRLLLSNRTSEKV